MKKYILTLLLFFSSLLLLSSFTNYSFNKQDPKKTVQDTLKKAVATEDVDSVITYKGKFKPYSYSQQGST